MTHFFSLAQINFLVGDIDGNVKKIEMASDLALKQGAGCVFFSELCLTGYPPEDLLLRGSMQARIERALISIAQLSKRVAVVIGHPWMSQQAQYNCLAVWHRGQRLALYKKQTLPNKQVFDEMRYFNMGHEPCVFIWQDLKVGLLLCEDVWQDLSVQNTLEAGAEIIFTLNASPFHYNKTIERRERLQYLARYHRCPFVYINQVGGQDELVFDGASFAVDANGSVVSQLSEHQSDLSLLTVKNDKGMVLKGSIKPLKPSLLALYDTLVLGVRDYASKNGFQSIILGLSGGIDSALTLVVAVEALGADRVTAVMMPFRYTSQVSLEDAKQQANQLGVQYKVRSIEGLYQACMASLASDFSGQSVDSTEENIQSRCRALLLMALSNKHGHLVLTTGNKSELAVGYATLYGDMAGGYNPLKDLYKTKVFELAKYCNKKARIPVIPWRVIHRQPSAELCEDQIDADSLPDYPLLDAILHRYIDEECSAESIVSQGFDKEIVYRVIQLVDRAQYKRQQAPPGVRVSEKAFGKDRRYPITQGWKAGI